MPNSKKFNRRKILKATAIVASQIAATAAFAQKSFIEPQPTKFRVLSLDGGGARGYLSAMILANAELLLNSLTKQQKPIGKRFDLIVGTSTGGIIALALARGKTAAEISNFYAKLVPTIFAENARRPPAHRITSPKYYSDTLSKELNSYFGNATLANLEVDVCITGVSLATGRPRFHKSNYQATNIGRESEKLADIALATSAAPTYFKAHTLQHSNRIVDGGICANNPSVIAVVDALRFERPSMSLGSITQKLSELVMISVGTGEQPSMPYDANTLEEAGIFYWAQHISDIMFESQSIVADTQSRFLLGENYLRINPKLGKAMLLDDVSDLHYLKNLADIDQGHVSFLRRHFL